MGNFSGVPLTHLFHNEVAKSVFMIHLHLLFSSLSVCTLGGGFIFSVNHQE
jgi:hypothetical protein